MDLKEKPFYRILPRVSKKGFRQGWPNRKKWPGRGSERGHARTAEYPDDRGMIMVGIVRDKGMFEVYYCKHKFQTRTYLAVTFAAATTLRGAGALLFTRRLILFSVGVTGVLSGYLSNVSIMPAL
jgi:hypothetical protein